MFTVCILKNVKVSQDLTVDLTVDFCCHSLGRATERMVAAPAVSTHGRFSNLDFGRIIGDL